ncbi:MAG: 3-oxoacyl-ACP synthase [Bacteroidia bacterium]
MRQFKEEILQKCKEIVDEKLQSLFYEFNVLNESAETESKSTAGDKHETGRAMIQLEQEKLGKQIQEWETQKTVLEKIDLCKDREQITIGSLIETNYGLFFIANNLGKITVNDQEIIIVSNHSPIAKLFSGCKLNDKLSFNNTHYIIKSIY